MTKIDIIIIISQLLMYLLLLYINRPNVSKLVSLHLGSQLTTVLCHMGDFGCGDGGWTPVRRLTAIRYHVESIFYRLSILIFH